MQKETTYRIHNWSEYNKALEALQNDLSVLELKNRQ